MSAPACSLASVTHSIHTQVGVTGKHKEVDIMIMLIIFWLPLAM